MHQQDATASRCRQAAGQASPAEPTPEIRVWQVVSMIPKGKVATYGQVAALAGMPAHARFVGAVLRRLPSNTKLPWQRVVNAGLRISLRGGGEADFRVDMRLGLPGPNADPAALVRPEGFHAGDPQLLELLGGTIPPDAERLAVEGGARDDRAWRSDGDLLLLTRAHLLSPGPRAAERGPGARWAYRLPDTPYALVTRGGREARLGFREREDVSLFEEIDDDE